MNNIRLSLQYDGSQYDGWQVQPNAKTVQGTIEALIRVIAPDSTRLVAAGRTDAGVHAIEQVATFRTASHHGPEVFARALNAQLPPDIRVTGASLANPSFHPRFDAKGKEYAYLIQDGGIASPFMHKYSWRVSFRLDHEAMNAASRMLVGAHDFSSFRGSGCGARTAMREVRSIEIRRSPLITFLDFPLQGEFLIITITANAFLRHMVRNIVGTLADVGRGAMRAEAMAMLLAARDRKCAGPTAPPGGLFLRRVWY
ncbi:MAG: tRNA pseudouridine(38-40) synthase TruA [Thermodesulfovibrionales bacterium]